MAIKSDLAGIMAAPQQHDAGTQLLLDTLGKSAKGLFGDRGPQVDVDDPASMMAEAQRLADEGDMEAAMKMRQQAQQAESHKTSMSNNAMAQIDASDRRGRQRGADREKLDAMHRANDTELAAVRTRTELLNQVKSRGYEDLATIAPGMTDAQISAAVLKKDEEQVKKSDMAEGANLIRSMDDGNSGDYYKNIADAVANGMTLTSALAQIERRQASKSPDKPPLGVLPTDDQVTYLNKAYPHIADMEEDRKRRWMTYAINLHRANPNMPGAKVQELTDEAVPVVKGDPETESQWLKDIKALWAKATAPAPEGTVAGAPVDPNAPVAPEPEPLPLPEQATGDFAVLADGRKVRRKK
jgi:hypothetical protein